MVAGETLISPFSFRRCVFYSALVEEYGMKRYSQSNVRSSGRRFWQWSELAREEIMGDVVLFDGSDFALVDTIHMDSHLIADAQFTLGTMQRNDSAMQKFLQRNRISAEDEFGIARSLRWKEGILSNGEYFTVAGKVEWKDPADYNLRIKASRILVITASASGLVYTSDDPELIDISDKVSDSSE